MIAAIRGTHDILPGDVEKWQHVERVSRELCDRYGYAEIRTPIIELSKAEIVKKGLELSAPLELSWSCYRNENNACGTCDSCALRLRGFEIAGVSDPIKYA